ncbi:hypothetical protein L596_028706 [Steinernema carpocapsae]|uniref:Uncharacterized protein n=1 Tax=Steinernema carpocapsae TaxID=34508 RepID=A0A4V5ZXY7_STECR|nr:hypothetical protein L596_028706 [Steinernema carpocapsae]
MMYGKILVIFVESPDATQVVTTRKEQPQTEILDPLLYERVQKRLYLPLSHTAAKRLRTENACLLCAES